MNNLEFETVARRMPLTFSFECLEAIIEKSHGEPIMSNTDVKLAILHLRGVVTQQNEMIELLVAEVQALKSKKSFIQKLLRK